MNFESQTAELAGGIGGFPLGIEDRSFGLTPQAPSQKISARTTITFECDLNPNTAFSIPFEW
jgi:hypothetical protein